MKYIKPEIEIILLSTAEVLTFSQEKEDIWENLED